MTAAIMGDVNDWRLRHIWPPLWASLGVAALAAISGALVQGPIAAAGAAAGVGLVTVSYLGSALLIAWADRIHSNLVFPFGMLAYVVKFTLFGLVMAGVAARDWGGLTAMGVGIVVGVVTWTAAQIVTVVRHGPHSPGAGARLPFRAGQE